MSEESENADAPHLPPADPSSAPPPPSGPRKPRSERREQAAADVLRTFVRDAHAEQFGAVLPKSEDVEIVIRLRARPREDWALRFEPSLSQQVLPQIEDAQAGWDVFRKGAVYCFRCDSSSCEHSLPDSPLAVFHGYAPTGVPEWTELAQVLIAAKDPRVDQLFDHRSGIVALVQFGRDLRERQLPSFGRASKTYSILGQVVAGYFPVAGEAESDARLAITFQAVEVRDAAGAPRLHLNMVARVPGEGSLSDLLASGWQAGIYRAREVAAREMDAMEQRVCAARADGRQDEAREIMRGIPALLRRLAESIERSRRQDARRTHHAERRRQEQRPVHKALEDALGAAQDAVFHDEKTGATIACGPQGRAHVFAAEGRHITSFILTPAAVEFRLRTQRWRPVTAEEEGVFRENLRKLVPEAK